MAVGLIFFIRAASKDRTRQVQLVAPESEAELLPRLQAYLDRRAYRIDSVDATGNGATFWGYVRPSWFLAAFLTLLAACGCLCLALIGTLLWPERGEWFAASLLLAPAAGGYYWQKAGRIERVSVQIEPAPEGGNGSRITVTAHRDEIRQLQQQLGWARAPEPQA